MPKTEAKLNAALEMLHIYRGKRNVGSMKLSLYFMKLSAGLFRKEEAPVVKVDSRFVN